MKCVLSIIDQISMLELVNNFRIAYGQGRGAAVFYDPPSCQWLLEGVFPQLLPISSKTKININFFKSLQMTESQPVSQHHLGACSTRAKKSSETLKAQSRRQLRSLPKHHLPVVLNESKAPKVGRAMFVLRKWSLKTLPTSLQRPSSSYIMQNVFMRLSQAFEKPFWTLIKREHLLKLATIVSEMIQVRDTPFY